MWKTRSNVSSEAVCFVSFEFLFTDIGSSPSYDAFHCYVYPDIFRIYENR